MIRSLWTAASGMAAQKLNMDVIANNLANVNTSGFKKSRADFQDLLYQIDPPTRSIQLVTEHLIGGTGRRAEPAVHAGPEN